MFAGTPTGKRLSNILHVNHTLRVVEFRLKTFRLLPRLLTKAKGDIDFLDFRTSLQQPVQMRNAELRPVIPNPNFGNNLHSRGSPLLAHKPEVERNSCRLTD